MAEEENALRGIQRREFDRFSQEHCIHADKRDGNQGISTEHSSPASSEAELLFH
jgi:hypothetical protein